MKNNKYSVVSLFTGAGRLDIGFEEFEKLNVICVSEIEKEVDNDTCLKFGKCFGIVGIL